MKQPIRKWALLATVLVATVLGGAALGEDHDPCYGAYLDSGLTAQQLSFDEFRWLYADTLCAPDGDLGVT